MSKDDNAKYYDAGGIETIDVIKAKLTEEQFSGFLLGNALKYMCRLNFKHADAESMASDIRKAGIYMTWLCEHYEDNHENN